MGRGRSQADLLEVMGAMEGVLAEHRGQTGTLSRHPTPDARHPTPDTRFRSRSRIPSPSNSTSPSNSRSPSLGPSRSPSLGPSPSSSLGPSLDNSLDNSPSLGINRN